MRADGLLGRIQDLLTSIDRWIGAACHLNRRTTEVFEAAGLGIVALEQQRLPLILLIIGIARPHL